MSTCVYILAFVVRKDNRILSVAYYIVICGHSSSTILSSAAILALPYFPHYLINDMTVGGGRRTV